MSADIKNNETKNNETNNDETNNDETKNNETNNDETKNNETKNNETNNDETNNDETNNDETNNDDEETEVVTVKRSDLIHIENKNNTIPHMKIHRIIFTVPINHNSFIPKNNFSTLDSNHKHKSNVIVQPVKSSQTITTTTNNQAPTSDTIQKLLQSEITKSITFIVIILCLLSIITFVGYKLGSSINQIRKIKHFQQSILLKQ